MKLMRQDPMKAAAQRHYPKYLPPPPGMYQQQMALPSRASTSPYGMHPYRPYPSHHARLLPPSTVSLMPHYAAAPSSLMLSALVNDHHYRPLPSDVQYKAVRIPSKVRKPAANIDSLNIADSVVRQLLDNYQQQQTESNHPSVLVIEDPDVASSSGQTEIFGDSLSSSPSQKVMVSPPVHAEYASDSSADVSSNSASNPEVFVIVSKNKSKNNNYYIDDKKADILTTSNSSPKLKKYKITSSYDENGGRQVWIIK